MKFYILGNYYEYFSINAIFLNLNEALDAKNKNYRESKLFSCEIGKDFNPIYVDLIPVNYQLKLSFNEGKGWFFYKDYFGYQEEIINQLKHEFEIDISEKFSYFNFNTKGNAYAGTMFEVRWELKENNERLQQITYKIKAQFLEDRNGRALVRLPNGSKASIEYNDITGE